jgi:hypothetical protein
MEQNGGQHSKDQLDSIPSSRQRISPHVPTSDDQHAYNVRTDSG